MAKYESSYLAPRKCKQCGKTFRPKDPRHETCFDCFQQHRESQYPTTYPASPAGGLALPNHYLKDGYFDSEGNILQQLVTDTAEEIAKLLGIGGVTSTQLRRFYTKAKAAEQRLDAGETFGSVIASILELKQHAANAVGKAQGKAEQKGLELLKQVVDRNVDVAVENEKAFRKGFLLHFQGIVAYFKFHNPKK